MPRVIILATEEAAASAAATWIAQLLTATPDVVLSLPAGRTPLSLYAALVARHRAGQADFSRAATFGLDEFVGLRPADRRSYHALLRRHLLDHVNVRRARTFTLNGAAADWRREVDAYERKLAAVGGLDLAVVGIGRNGHIGFNEPAGRLEARTHRVRLRAETRRANAAQFGGRLRDVPAYALSMGMGTILSARGVLLLAFGRHKAATVRRALTGPVTTQVPASLLQLHPNALVVLDREAAGVRPGSDPGLTQV
jgi:glucosamine-6-phosphate deaminase